MTFPLPEAESPYKRFRQHPNELDEDGYQISSLPSPLSIIDRDGSVLYEDGQFYLRTRIISRNDVTLLEQYLAIAPWAIDQVDLDDVTRSSDVFYIAAQSGSVDALKTLLAHYSKVTSLTQKQLYADIHTRHHEGRTAILCAADTTPIGKYDYIGQREVCLDDNEAVMNLLLDRGSCASDVASWRDADRDKEYSDTVLTFAVKWASPELIKRLIDSGANVHAKVVQNIGFLPRYPCLNFSRDVTAVFIASLYANFKAIEILIEQRGDGVDIADMTSSRDSQGRLPLHWATQCRLTYSPSDIPASRLTENAHSLIRIINLLLDIDPTTVNIQDDIGNTPLHYAALCLGRLGTQHTGIFKLLCDRGADASIRNIKKETPLHTIFYHGFSRSPVDITAIATLLAHGAKTTDIDETGNTPLHYAAWNLFYSDTVSFLLKQGADTRIRNLNQETPLHSAADSILYAHDRFGETPLRTIQKEVFKAQEDMIAELVEAGGIELMDQRNQGGKSPRQIRQEWKDYARDEEEIGRADKNGTLD
ncbi:hypothetical protein FSARC_10544, partial [Fusarium sarcochroum]